MTDKQPAEWALKMAKKYLGGRRNGNGEIISWNLAMVDSLSRFLDARFGPALEAAKAVIDVHAEKHPTSVVVRLAAALDEFGKETKMGEITIPNCDVASGIDSFWEMFWESNPSLVTHTVIDVAKRFAVFVLDEAIRIADEESNPAKIATRLRGLRG